jgi:hypothetical protein
LGYTNRHADGNCHTNCNGYIYSNPDSNSYKYSNGDCNCNHNAYGDAYRYGETYTNPKDRSYTKSSADARAAPVASKVDLLAGKVFRAQPTRLLL